MACGIFWHTGLAAGPKNPLSRADRGRAYTRFQVYNANLQISFWNLISRWRESRRGGRNGFHLSKEDSAQCRSPKRDNALKRIFSFLFSFPFLFLGPRPWQDLYLPTITRSCARKIFDYLRAPLCQWPTPYRSRGGSLFEC